VSFFTAQLSPPEEYAPQALLRSPHTEGRNDVAAPQAAFLSMQPPGAVEMLAPQAVPFSAHQLGTPKLAAHAVP
jgi:hypothetical protein